MPQDPCHASRTVGNAVKSATRRRFASGNARGRRLAAARAWCAGIIAAIGTVLGPAAAEPGGAAAPPIPSASGVLAAYDQVEAWVRAGKTPLDPVLIDPPGATGASVTLRLSGKVLGRAANLADDRAAVWRAARDAWSEAKQNMPVERDALREQRVAELLPRITIELEVAGALTPLLGETFAVAAAELSPGIEGVAARVQDVSNPVFPGVMLTAGMSPAEAVRSAAVEMGLPPVELGQLRKVHRLALYKFPCRTIASARPGAPARFLYRGGEIVPIGAVSGAGLRAFADGAAEHLMLHGWPGAEPHGMSGDYNPVTDRFDPLVAGPVQQAAAALALLRYAAAPGTIDTAAARAQRFAGRLLNELKLVAPGEEEPLASAVASAAFVAAWAEAHAHDAAAFPRADPFFAEAVVRLRAARGEQGGWEKNIEPPARALIAFGLVRASRLRPDDAALRADAAAAVRQLFRDTAPAELVALMPWLGWAELELAGPGGEIPARDALLEFRRLVWRFQLDESQAGDAAADLAGGIVFTRGRTPLPAWTTLRPLAFAATMLGDERLTPPADRVRELASLRRSLRFMLQLSPREAECRIARDPRRALGGVRRAVWEPALSTDATVLGLLTACETLRAIGPAEGGASDAAR